MSCIKKIISILLAVALLTLCGCRDGVQNPLSPEKSPEGKSHSGPYNPDHDSVPGVSPDNVSPDSPSTSLSPDDSHTASIPLVTGAPKPKEALPVVEISPDAPIADGTLGDPASDNGWGYMMSAMNDERYILVMNQIFDGIKSFETSISVDPILSAEETKAFIDVILSNIAVEYCFVDSLGAKIYADESDLAGVLASVEVIYNVSSLDEGLEMVSELRTAANDVIGRLEGSWSDYRKIKYLHDWLILKCAPDENDIGGIYGETAYGAVVEGRPTCLGYGKAMLYLLGRAGYDCAFVVGIGREARHIWIKVRVGEEWYCIDPTWSDPLSLTLVDPEYIDYDYFMVTDEFMKRTHFDVFDMVFYSVPEADSDELCWHNVEECYADSYEAAVKILTDATWNAVNGGSEYEYVRIKFSSEELYLRVKDDFSKSKYKKKILSRMSDRYTLSDRYLGSDKWTLTYVLKRN